MNFTGKIYKKIILISYLAGDERLSHQQEDIEAEEPTQPPSDHHVTVGNLLVNIHSCIEQHRCKNMMVGISFYLAFLETNFFIKD